MTNPESHVEQQVQARITAARRKREHQQRQRAELAENRAHGLRARHAAKTARMAHCPACRAPRPAQQISAIKVRGQTYDLVQCLDKACELIWATRADQPSRAA